MPGTKLGNEARGDVMIASRSARPASVASVTRDVIIPSLLDTLLSGDSAVTAAT
jgi:hypothetical protein